jgi:peptidoglycan/LPS O-acetylase OafA/YrhL
LQSSLEQHLSSRAIDIFLEPTTTISDIGEGGSFASPNALLVSQCSPSVGGYRPDVDGLRAVAVLGVIGFHAFPVALPGGFVGVDVFFVISGFLISGIVLRGLAAGSFRFAEFYARRVRRIFPGLLLVLTASLAFGWYVLLADEFERLGKHAAAGAGFVANLWLWHEGGYFNRDAVSNPLLHLWSLGVEEQFYLLWPPLLVLAWRRSRRSLPWIAALVTIASLATNLAIVHRFPRAAFYAPFSRFWELSAGGLLAYARLGRSGEDDNRRRADAMSWVGIGLIALSFSVVTERRAFPGAWAAVPTLGACLIIAAGPRAVVNRRVLSNRLLVGIGLISYPLYLWHWPLLSFARIIAGRPPGRGLCVALVAGSFVVAYGTGSLVEGRVRRARGRRPLLVLASLVAVNLVGGLAIVPSGARPRNSGNGVDRIIEARRDLQYPPEGFAPFSLNGRTYRQHAGGGGRALLFGDSHLEQYGARIHRVLAQRPADGELAYLVTSGGCPPIPGVEEDQHPGCDDWRADALELARRPEIDTIVVGACWACYFIEMTAPPDGEWRRGTPESFEYYFEDRGIPGGGRRAFRAGDATVPALAALEEMLAMLVRTQKRVFLLLDNPIGTDLDPQTYLAGNRLTTLRCLDEVAPHQLAPREQELRRQLKELAGRAGAVVIDPVPSLCAGDLCPIRDGRGSFIYRDGNHLRASTAGAERGYLDVALRAVRAPPAPLSAHR